MGSLRDVKSQGNVNFKCPVCKSSKLIVVYQCTGLAIGLYSEPVKSVTSENLETGDGEIYLQPRFLGGCEADFQVDYDQGGDFRCGQCGAELRDRDGKVISTQDYDALVEWLEDRQ